MPFRSFRRDVEPGAPVHLYTAEPGDVAVEVRAAAFSDDNMSVGFSFRIGGPDIGKTGGLACFNSEWSSEVEAGDEIWIEVFGAAFTHTTPITMMIRSTGAKKPARASAKDASSA